MYRNIQDGSIAAEDIVEIDAAITTLETKLIILVGLTGAERQSLQGLGPQSASFADQALLAGQQNAGLMPRDLNLAAIQRDKVLRETLLPRFERMRHLTTKMDHTIHLAGAEYYSGGLAIYRALRAFGRGFGLDDLIAELGRRFARTKAKTEPAPETASEPEQPSI
jgi:hypothetical protein